MPEKENQHDATFIAEELHRLFDTIPEVPYSALPLERPEVICFARRIEVLTGYSADEILVDRQLWINMVHPADRERVFAAFVKCRKCGIPFEIDYRIIHKDGSVHHVIDEAEPVFNDKGQVLRVEGVITDVSEYEAVSIPDPRKVQEIAESNSVDSSVLQRI